MAAIQIIDVEEVLAKTGQQDITEVSDVLVAAINTTTVYLEGLLLTTFAAGTAVDRFRLAAHDIDEEFVKLRLSKGFVTSVPVITKGLSPYEARQAGADVVDPSRYFYDAEKGIITIDVELGASLAINPGVAAGDFLQITYDHGFAEEPSGQYDRALVPEWLAEAAVRYCLHIMNNTPGLTVEEADAKKATIFEELIEPHLRFAPQAIKAL